MYCANCCFNCCAEHSHKDSVRSTAAEEQLKQQVVQRSEPSFHLPALDLSWANLRVQLHLPPLDLAWPPQMIAQLFVTVQLTSLLLISPGLYKKGKEGIDLYASRCLWLGGISRTLFIRTKHNMQIFGVIPFIKLQNDTYTIVKR